MVGIPFERNSKMIFIENENKKSENKKNIVYDFYQLCFIFYKYILTDI